MNNIINLYKRRSDNMYFEALIENLTANPAKNYTIREAEKLAQRVLKDYGADNLNGATPIIKIANSFGFSCIQAQNIPEDISGNIFVGETTKKVYDSDKVIVVDYNEPLEHKRFIVAHELAHYLIDYLGSAEAKNPNYLFSRTYPKQSHHSENEVRADRFAAELLMPSQLFLKQYVRAMEVSDFDKKYTVSYLSNYFKTKKSSVERRINEVIT